jgi:hypothetical protein
LTYFFFRVFVNSIRASIYTSFILLCLSYIHHLKYSLTGLPLTYNDLQALEHISLVQGYLEFRVLVIVFMLLLSVLAVHYYFKDKVSWEIKSLLRRVLPLLVLAPLVFHLHIKKIHNSSAIKSMVLNIPHGIGQIILIKTDCLIILFKQVEDQFHLNYL